MTALTDISVATCRELIARQALSPVELVTALLEQIERLQPVLHAFVTVTAERALADARLAERALMRGDRLGALHGVPFAVKDVLDTAGVLTTGQSRQLAAHVPKADATVVARLRAAGGVLLGKLTTHEFAIGGPDFDLPWSPARNPWNVEHFAGGSSSGSAAAVASGMVPLALGTDTGGSIRNPATLCGVVGLKPTYGLISRKGMLPLSFSLDHIGPLTRSVEDGQLALQVLFGQPASPGEAPRLSIDDLRDLRVGVVPKFIEHSDPEPVVLAGIRAAIDCLSSAGAQLEEVDLGDPEEYETCGQTILRVESHVLHRHWLSTTPELFGPRCRERLEMGQTIEPEAYRGAWKLRAQLKRRADDVLSRCAVLVTAATVETAPILADPVAIERHNGKNMTMPFNVTGLPAIVVPAGLSERGLPTSVQFVGGRGDERSLFRAAAAFEARRPPLPGPAIATGTAKGVLSEL